MSENSLLQLTCLWQAKDDFDERFSLNETVQSDGRAFERANSREPDMVTPLEPLSQSVGH